MTITRFNRFLQKNKKILNLTIGEIELLKVLGQGGNGIVYSGIILGKEIALKFLLSDSRGKSLRNKTDRFLAEYFNIATIEDSQGLVKYIDYDELTIEDEHGSLQIPVILMKKYDSSLTTLQAENDKGKFLKLVYFLLKTIENIHSHGIIHRDLKPENILVNNNNLVLADFGIASYNPSIFSLRAKTKKGERVGNRLFSAPEQEEGNVLAHETMDIYSFGQILQWFATGSTHRGTNRESITKVYKDLWQIDNVIDKCLSQNPKDRFQSIHEITLFLSHSKKEKDAFDYLNIFNKVLRISFPKNENRIIHSTDLGKIDRLFNNFKRNEEKFDRELWWHDGLGNYGFKLLKKGLGVWKFDSSEYSIKEIWIHYDNSSFNDFILVHFKKSDPFKIEGKETYYTTIVDAKHHISYSEYQNGYAEIDDEIIDLSEHEVELIERQEEEGYFFIGTRFHCILNTSNDDNVYDIIQNLKECKGKIDLDELKKFQRLIRRHKAKSIISRL